MIEIARNNISEFPKVRPYQFRVCQSRFLPPLSNSSSKKLTTQVSPFACSAVQEIWIDTAERSESVWLRTAADMHSKLKLRGKSIIISSPSVPAVLRCLTSIWCGASDYDKNHRILELCAGYVITRYLFFLLIIPETSFQFSFICTSKMGNIGYPRSFESYWYSSSPDREQNSASAQQNSMQTDISADNINLELHVRTGSQGLER